MPHYRDKKEGKKLEKGRLDLTDEVLSCSEEKEEEEGQMGEQEVLEWKKKEKVLPPPPPPQVPVLSRYRGDKKSPLATNSVPSRERGFLQSAH